MHNPLIPDSVYLYTTKGGERIFSDTSRSSLIRVGAEMDDLKWHSEESKNQHTAIRDILNILGEPLTAMVFGHSKKHYTAWSGDVDSPFAVITVKTYCKGLVVFTPHTKILNDCWQLKDLVEVVAGDHSGHSANMIRKWLKYLMPEEKDLEARINAVPESLREEIFQKYELDLTPEVVLDPEPGFMLGPRRERILKAAAEKQEKVWALERRKEEQKVLTRLKVSGLWTAAELARDAKEKAEEDAAKLDQNHKGKYYTFY